jgi:hypothetical protein
LVTPLIVLQFFALNNFSNLYPLFPSILSELERQNVTL